jgi:cation transport regulator ChaC
VPSAKKVAVGELHSHQLRFHKVSKKDRSGKCDAFRTDNDQDRVFGVLFEIPEEEKANLDKWEGRGYGYDEKIVDIHLPGGEVAQAFTYTATNIDESLRPLDWYKEHVIRGARENALPVGYIKKIEAIKCDEDTDTERREREMSIY